jgi:hypothetical protein
MSVILTDGRVCGRGTARQGVRCVLDATRIGCAGIGRPTTTRRGAETAEGREIDREHARTIEGREGGLGKVVVSE